MYFYLKFYDFILNKGFKKFEKKKFFINFSKNEFLPYTSTTNTLNSYFIYIFDKFVFKKLTFLVANLFSFNKNLLFVDIETNYNYLPIDNSVLFSRSFSKLHKLIKYFNIAVVCYINLKKKKFVFKKLYDSNLINVSLSNTLVRNKFDLNLNITSKVVLYVFYLMVLNLYIKVKNKI